MKSNLILIKSKTKCNRTNNLKKPTNKTAQKVKFSSTVYFLICVSLKKAGYIWQHGVKT